MSNWKLVVRNSVVDRWVVEAGAFTTELAANKKAARGEQAHFERQDVSVLVWVAPNGHEHTAELGPSTYLVGTPPDEQEFDKLEDAQAHAAEGEVPREKLHPIEPDFDAPTEDDRDPGPKQPWAPR